METEGRQKLELIGISSKAIFLQVKQKPKLGKILVAVSLIFLHL